MEPASKTATIAAYASATGTLYFGLTMNELGVLVGIGATLGTLVMNWWFKNEHLKLARKAGKALDD